MNYSSEKSTACDAAPSGTISVTCDDGTVSVSIDGGEAEPDNTSCAVTESSKEIVVTVSGLTSKDSDVKITVEDGADDSNTKEFTVSKDELEGEETYTATLTLTGTFSTDEDGNSTLTLKQSDGDDSVAVTLS